LIESISWGSVSALLIIVSGVPYMWDIYTGKVERPVVTSWILWLVIGVILLVSSYTAGASLATTLPAMVAGVLNPAIIVYLSWRYGSYTLNRVDKACILVCIITISVWQITDSALLGIIGGILADAIAAIPQIIKSWKDPSDEPVFPWTMFCFASSINFLAIDVWILEMWVYPLYMTAGSLLICIPIILHRIRHVKKVT